MRRVALAAALVLAVGAPVASAGPRRNYEQLWKQERQFYAPAQPSPLVKFNRKMTVPGARAVTSFAAGTPRVIYLSRSATRELARGDREVIEWEWGRVFGPAQQPSFPGWLVGLTNRLDAVHARHASRRRTAAYARSHLERFGENPRAIFDEAPPPAQPGPSLPPTCPSGYYVGTDGRCYPFGTCPVYAPVYHEGACYPEPGPAAGTASSSTRARPASTRR